MQINVDSRGLYFKYQSAKICVNLSAFKSDLNLIYIPCNAA